MGLKEAIVEAAGERRDRYLVLLCRRDLSRDELIELGDLGRGMGKSPEQIEAQMRTVLQMGILRNTIGRETEAHRDGSRQITHDDVVKSIEATRNAVAELWEKHKAIQNRYSEVESHKQMADDA